MDKSKAKKAVKKSAKRKKQAEVENAQALLALQAASGGALDPEIQAAQIDMQPVSVNPYRELGSMAPMQYTPGNMLTGYNYPVMVSPGT